MPRLQTVATAVPATKVDQDYARQFAREVFGDRFKGLERLLPLFTNAGIETRYFVGEPAWYRERHDMAERSALYVMAASSKARRAARADSSVAAFT